MDELERYLLQAAIRAPSGDNCQPWKFHFLESNKLAISIVPSLASSFFDVGFRATYISVGAVVQNIRIAAATKNLAIEVSYQDFKVGQTPVAFVIFKENTPFTDKKNQENYLAMMKRTVNRRPFLPKPLSVETWQELLNVETPENISVMTYIGKEKGQWAKAVRAADMIRWTHPKIHQELFQKIRYTAEEAQATQDGLEIDRLGAGPAAKYMMKFLSSWSRQCLLNNIGGARALAGQTVSLLHASSGLVGVWGKSDDASTWMQGGEVIQKLWIQAQKLGLAVQPLPIAIYLKKRFDLVGEEDFQTIHQPYVSKLSHVIDFFAKSNKCNSEPLMLFRVGKTLPMKNTAVRKPLQEFLQ